MAEQQQQTIGSEEGVPLLRPRDVRPNALARLLNRAAGRRGGGPSNMVRETAAVQLEERRADWGYSKPVVALDIAWNLAFTVVSIVMLSSTLGERPNTPIRVWIGGYALQCVIHVLLVSLEYRRRRRTTLVVNNTRTRTTSTLTTLEEGLRTSTSSSSSSDDDSEDDEVDDARTSFSANTGNRSSIAKRCESINTMASFFWWIVGFYWIVSGGDILLHNAPRLYWLAVVFLAFDVFFAIFCVALACMIGIALCCCLPCIIAVLYAVAGQEGATESDLSILRKYNYKVFTNGEKSTGGAGRMVPVHGELADTHVLLPEDAECCICLSSYEDAAELHALPCSHHFHSTCIVKWLKINASCPLCKYNILKGNDQI